MSNFWLGFALGAITASIVCGFTLGLLSKQIDRLSARLFPVDR